MTYRVLLLLRVMGTTLSNFQLIKYHEILTYTFFIFT